jgi:hypothetical protein
VKDCHKSVGETEEEGRKRNDKKRRSAGNDRIGMEWKGIGWRIEQEERTRGEDREGKEGRGSDR